MFEIGLFLLFLATIFGASVVIVAQIKGISLPEASKKVWNFLKAVFPAKSTKQNQSVEFPLPGYDPANNFFYGRDVEMAFSNTLSHFDGAYWDSKTSACVANTYQYAFSFARADEDSQNADYLTGLAEADLQRFFHSKLVDVPCSPLVACNVSGNVLYIAVARNSAGCPEIQALREQVRAIHARDNAPATADDIEV